jgi:hypothetical protein
VLASPLIQKQFPGMVNILGDKGCRKTNVKKKSSNDRNNSATHNKIDLELDTSISTTVV